MGGAAGRVGMPTNAQGTPNAQGGPTQGQLPPGLQDFMARIQANPQSANLPMQSMIQRIQQPMINRTPFDPSYINKPQGEIYQPPVFRPQVLPQRAPAPGMAQPGQPSEIEQLRAEIAALRGNQNQYSGGGN